MKSQRHNKRVANVSVSAIVLGFVFQLIAVVFY